MPTSRTRAVVIGLVAAIGLAACGGGDDPEPGDVPQATSACTEAFAAAREEMAATAVGGDTAETGPPLDAEGRQAAAEGERARLGLLIPSLAACEDAGDWMAGARSAPDMLPSRIDRRTALGLLCRAAADDGGDGATEPASCEALLDAPADTGGG